MRKKLNQGNIFVTMAKPPSLNMERPTLPITERIALYGRQSTLYQVQNNLESYDDQTKKSRGYIQQLGWEESSIVEYFQDFGVSGTLGFGERVGITKLAEDIESNYVKAVYVQQEDRLFRDKYLVNEGVSKR